jgi:hypothetical protein
MTFSFDTARLGVEGEPTVARVIQCPMANFDKYFWTTLWHVEPMSDGRGDMFPTPGRAGLYARK